MVLRLYLPVRPGKDNRTLRYAIRSWHHFFPDLEPVLFGGCPWWWTGESVRVRQKVGPLYQWSENFPAIQRAMIEHSGGEPFVYTHDDLFVIEPIDPATTWCRSEDITQHLEAWRARPRQPLYTRMFRDGLESQAQIVMDLGLPLTHNADAHMPHPLDPHRLADLMDLMAADYPCHPQGHFRMVYGQVWPERVVRSEDPKVVGPTASPKSGLPFVSTDASSWAGAAGRFVRSLYDTPSPWESTQ